MSINRAQAQALAEGFLNSVGSDSSDFKPIELLTEAITIAGEFVSLAQANCPVHAGKLAASIQAEEPKQVGSAVSVEITMLSYGQFVDKGVKGIKSGAGKFSFKNDMPSRSMLNAITEYLKTAKLSTANINNRPISKHEVKNKRLADISHVFALARSIKQHGIKAVNFIDKAANVIETKFTPILQDALRKDLYNTLPNRL